MQKVFHEVNSLDNRCYEEFGLTEDILMENAANSMAQYIEKNFSKKSKILIVAGMGNNGADGITLARILYGYFSIDLYIPFELRSGMAKKQLDRLKRLSSNIIVDKIDTKYDVVVDCLFGSGLTRELDDSSVELIDKLNSIDAKKIACDIPSGINNIGQINKTAFISDITITMGALKKSLFTDEVKDFVGKIKVANLGIQREIYEGETDCFLLDKKDLKLPYRTTQSTHKGTFGHLSVIVGDKRGAAILSSMAAFEFGVGLITAITKDQNLPLCIMGSKTLPINTTAIAIGMGLGDISYKKYLKNNIPTIVDADMFYKKYILKLLHRDNIVLTPHPKEFVNLLKLTNIANISIEQLQKDRFRYVDLFSKKYPNIVLLLKGANVLIAHKRKIYINRYGSSKLSFGGSGDVLSGLIGSLLAQGYTPFDAAISGSLSHTFLAKGYKKSNFSLTPKGLIKQIKKL